MDYHEPASGGKPRAYRAIDFCLDRLLPPVRKLMYPIHILLKLGTSIARGIWLLRNEYVKSTLKECGKGVRIHGRFRVTAPEEIALDENVHINDNAFIRAEGGLSIGANTHISRNLVLYTMNHDYEGTLLPYDSAKILKPVHIGENVWIGTNVCIAPGTRIGDGAIIAMGAVVSGEVAPLSIVGTPPLRVLKERNQEHYNALIKRAKYGGMSGYPVENKNSL